MANQKQVEILLSDVDNWNNWRREILYNTPIGESTEVIDFSEANFNGAELRYANLREANLSNSHLWNVNLEEASLIRANLTGAELIGANLSSANFSEADLSGADLREAKLWETDFSQANLNRTNLIFANFIRTKIDNAKLSSAYVYGVNVWELTGNFLEQKDLIITPHGTPAITVDNIKISQFIHLILNNAEIREVINTLTSKAVLILRLCMQNTK
jgi:uncharacterized protein YjbI with pentapeptide repeats